MASVSEMAQELIFDMNSHNNKMRMIARRGNL